MTSTTRRRNLVEADREDWRPARFTQNLTPSQSWLGWARRMVDLQAASIWIDLERELAQADGSLLDVGCGHQPYRRLIPSGVRYQGLDTREAAVQFGYSVPDTLLVSGYPWPVVDSSFDVVLCTEVAEHVLDPAALFAEIHRCLRPGGRLILTVPFAARWHFVPHDYWRYTPSGLAHLLGSAGFTGTIVHGRGNPLTVACQKVVALLPTLISRSTGGPGRQVARRAAAVPVLPAAALAGLVGRVSLRADWGEDCLGYTVTTRRGST